MALERQKADTQRYLQVLGENLQILIKRMMANQKLLRYLYYTDKDPLSEEHPDLKGSDLFGDQIRIIPIIGTKDDPTSIITLRVLKAVPVQQNSEYMDVYFDIEVFVPNTQWILKSNNLRPYLIMGEINKSINGTKIKGLGEVVFDSLQINFLTEEMSCYNMVFHITQSN